MEEIKSRRRSKSNNWQGMGGRREKRVEEEDRVGEGERVGDGEDGVGGRKGRM